MDASNDTLLDANFSYLSDIPLSLSSSYYLDSSSVRMRDEGRLCFVVGDHSPSHNARRYCNSVDGSLPSVTPTQCTGHCDIVDFMW